MTLVRNSRLPQGENIVTTHWISEYSKSFLSSGKVSYHLSARQGLVTVLESGLYASLADESAELLTKFHLHHAFFWSVIFKVGFLLI